MSVPTTLYASAGQPPRSEVVGDLASWPDHRLLAAVRLGSGAAYGELWRRHSPVAVRFARSLVPQRDVDDVVSESFAKMLRAIRAGRGPVDDALKYLMVAVRTTAFTLSSRNARVVVSPTLTEPRQSAVGPLDLLGGLEDERLEAAFASLSLRWRQVLWWSEVEGLSAVEVGDRMGLRPSAVSALAYRARRALRDAYLAARAPVPVRAPEGRDQAD